MSDADSSKPRSFLGIWLAAIFILLASTAFYFWAGQDLGERSGESYSGEFPEKLAAPTIKSLAQMASAVRQNPDAPALPVLEEKLLKNVKRPVYVGLRSEGKLVSSHWASDGTWEKNLETSLTEAYKWLPPLYVRDVDSVEICLTHSYQDVEITKELELSKGVLGLEMGYGNGFSRIPPVEMLAQNLSFQRALDRFLIEQDQDPKSTLRGSLHLKSFSAYQVLVHFEPEARATEMFRGNSHQPDLVTQADVASLTNELARWMLRQVDEEGGIPYLVFPGYDETSNRNNLMARQCLATWSLGRLAKVEPSPERREIYRRNIRHNLLTYFRTDGFTAGMPETSGKLGLGGLALFGLALQEDREMPQFEFLERVINAGIEEMWNPDTGAFRSYKNPVAKDNNQNFYPGEALLYWSVLIESDRHPELLPKFKKSFQYYRTFHRENQNPAFIPWHTQAYYKVWRVDKDPELKDFIFEMNDWLLEMVQWDKAEFDDFRGQFWNPEKPQYGSRPHVSSTSVYLEGLTIAFRLARDVGDKERERIYREAILKGLRSLMIHQFRDEVDMFYVLNPSRVRGGLRTTVYNSLIRCDNGAHALMALLRIRDLFEPEDYRFGE